MKELFPEYRTLSAMFINVLPFFSYSGERMFILYCELSFYIRVYAMLLFVWNCIDLVKVKCYG